MYNYRWIAIATRYGRKAHLPSIYLHEQLAVGANRMTTISIPLGKKGKYAGKYTAIVDSIDADLDQYNWHVQTHRPICVYASRMVTIDSKRKSIFMHRVILARKLNRDELLSHELVDHINGNGLDNRRENLRLATDIQNKANRRQSRSVISGMKGVYKQGNKWMSCIGFNNQSIYLGTFQTKKDAHKAYCAKALELYGEYANFGDNVDD